ncbi:hypothetical protein [Methylocystis parvus]|uniref:Uncharacterized protein n=1 Tax=Methylocystis parvus TaxID=134 RepID=A0A6B8M8Q1_9HYPH|nr:hypothetical protein [Methylocystis parvus]QGM98262.1 hypothetical protein F7D14_12765 [Methylocystis parvus]WBK01413.1 hypothetical protein MMG94_06810 [Methylocystis parvus OBBP]
MRRFPFLSVRRLVAHPVVQGVSSQFSARSAVAGLCFFLIATAADRQMDAAYRQSIVKEGRYSLVESLARPWHARDLRVGWTKNGAYVALLDYAALETFALGGFTLSFLAFLTPAAWLALAYLKAREANDVAESEPSDAVHADGATPASPLVESLNH